MMMASDSTQIKDLVSDFILLIAVWDETKKSDKGCKALQQNYEDFIDSGASISECNTVMYEMVKERLKSDGKINDSMSETQIDWIIFTNSIVTRSIQLTHFVYQRSFAFDSIKWENQTYVKLLEFPRFIGFNVRTNKRCLLTWIELFTKLLDIETKKRKADSFKKKISYESSKFIQQCQSIIETCDIWNDKDVLQHPEFQIDFINRICEQLFECDSRTGGTTFKSRGLDKIWTNRLSHLCQGIILQLMGPEEELDISFEAMRLAVILGRKCPKTLKGEFVRSYCSIPLTEDEEKYLLERRLKFKNENPSKCKVSPPNNTRNQTKVKRGIKARAAREAAAKEKRSEREIKRKRKMWYLMNYNLYNIFELSSEEPTSTTFTDLARHVFQSKLKRQKPEMGTISFKDWRYIDLLIQLIKVEAVPEWTKDKLTFQLNATSYTAVSKRAPIKGNIEMGKEEALDALRNLRKKLRRDPAYFSDL